MIFTDLVNIVSKAAPVLGTALGGPIGGIVGSLIGNVFGGSTKDIPDLVKKIQSDPEAALKLKTLEYQHADNLAMLAQKKFETEVEDRKSARDRELSLAKLGIHDHMPHVIACMMVGAVIAVVFAQFIPGINTSNSVIVGQVCGLLTREVIQICAYYFGAGGK